MRLRDAGQLNDAAVDSVQRGHVAVALAELVELVHEHLQLCLQL